jgi:quinol monooxygenase YgiN
MIIIAGWIEVEAGERDALVTASMPFQRSTREDEPGCLSYLFSADPLFPARVHIYEAWASADALEQHFEHPNFTAMRKLIGSFHRLGASMSKYRVDATSAVIGADGKPSSQFFDAEGKAL